MLTMTVKVGDVLEISDAVAIKVLERRGQRVGLAIATALGPIKVNPTGIIAERFSSGITGVSRYMPETGMARAG